MDYHFTYLLYIKENISCDKRNGCPLIIQVYTLGNNNWPWNKEIMPSTLQLEDQVVKCELIKGQ